MKEDILEQIGEDYLNLIGYFTQTNIKFRPLITDLDWDGRKDGVYSDIDIIGFNPNKHAHEKVVAISCKSWQNGFRAKWEIENIANHTKKVSGRERWKAYRELASPKWGKGFCQRIKELTGQTEFEYWILCTKFYDPENESLWIENERFKDNLTPYLRIMSLDRIFHETANSLSSTPANSQLGRLIQLLKVAVPNFGR